MRQHDPNMTQRASKRNCNVDLLGHVAALMKKDTDVHARELDRGFLSICYLVYLVFADLRSSESEVPN